MEKISAVVFDLDGTLLRTEHFQWKGWVEALKPLGIRMSARDYYDYTGKSGILIEDMLVKRYSLEIGRGSLLAKKQHFLEKWFRTENLYWMPYARSAINFFKGKGLKVAVATSSPKEEMHLKLRRAGAEKLFDQSICQDDVKRGKPYPDIYLFACDRLGMAPENCIAFEDTYNGFKSAKDAGLKVAVIPNPYSRAQDFSSAWRVFASFKEAMNSISKEDVL